MRPAVVAWRTAPSTASSASRRAWPGTTSRPGHPYWRRAQSGSRSWTRNTSPAASATTGSGH